MTSFAQVLLRSKEKNKAVNLEKKILSCFQLRITKVFWIHRSFSRWKCEFRVLHSPKLLTTINLMTFLMKLIFKDST